MNNVNFFGDKHLKVVRVVGDLQKAYLEEDWTTVYRSKEITIPAFESTPKQIIKCAPMDNHFIFRHVYKKNGKPTRGWTLWCTCGGPAVITDYRGYYHNNSTDNGQLLICYHHAMYGKHMDGSN